MDRRQFLGILGGTIAVAATADVFGAEPLFVETLPILGRTVYVYDIVMAASGPGGVSVNRPGGAALLQTRLSSGGVFRWVACPGAELVAFSQQAMLEITGPVSDWSMHWFDGKTHQRFVTTSRAGVVTTIPLYLDPKRAERVRRKRLIREWLAAPKRLGIVTAIDGKAFP